MGFLLVGPVFQIPNPPPQKKKKHFGEKEMEQIVLPVLFSWDPSSMVSAQ